MKKSIITVMCIAITLASTRASCNTPNIPGEKPFRTAIVFSGLVLNTAFFLGMFDGIETSASGLKDIDLIIGSCGGAIAAALINTIPDSTKRLEYIKSETFHKTLLINQERNKNTGESKVNNAGILKLASIIVKLGWEASDIRSVQNKILQEYKQRKIENTTASTTIKEFLSKNSSSGSSSGEYTYPFSNSLDADFSLLRLDDDEFEKSKYLRKNFNKNNIPIILIGSRAGYSSMQDLHKTGGSYPEHLGSSLLVGMKRFTEILLTDKHTASKIPKNFKSFIGSTQPMSAIRENVAIISDLTLAQAVRISVSDPILIGPVEIENNHYLTGAVNLYPINIAESLADKVVTLYPYSFPFYANWTMLSAFKFDTNKIRYDIIEKNSNVNYWVDMSDLTDTAPRMTPGVEYISFQWNVPENYDDYKIIVEKQYAYGFNRSVESLNYKDSKSHIRNRLEEP